MTVRCDRAGCAGSLASTGYCDVCGRPPIPVPSPPRTRPAGSSPGGLTALPVYRVPAAADRLLHQVSLPGGGQRCGSCARPVGRGHRGQLGLVEGFCGYCRTPYSFGPKLAAGDVLADRYVINGCLAHGGLGWVYLARDTHLDDGLVVLKGVLNSADPAMVEASVRERQELRDLHHPGIVRIFDAVTGPVPGTAVEAAYIVMAYVDGLSLQQVIADPRGSEDGAVRVEQVVNCGLQICAALEYLHGRDRLYCDMKPANVMLTGGRGGPDDVRIVLVDIGGVRRTDDRRSPSITTAGFTPSRQEDGVEKPSVRLDVYQVGMTLHLLAEIAVDNVSDSDLSAAHPAGAASFRRLVNRARQADPDLRFSSMAELAEQLRGVRRELAAERTGRQFPAESELFAPAAVLLDDGLGAAPGLDRWTGRADPPTSTGRPTAARAAVGLSTPRVDPADPAADLLAQTAAVDARRLLDKLAGHRLDRPGSAAVEWLACRAHLELGQLQEARACLTRGKDAGWEPGGRWRASWHQGLVGLAAGDLAAALSDFEAVRAVLPGEVAPQLAVGCTAEQLGDLDLAERCYLAVWQRDHVQASAAFGAARTALARGDRRAAVQLLDAVPEVSRHVDAARVAAVRARCTRLPGEHGLPGADDFADAEGRLASLVYLDDDSRRRLTAWLQEVALDRVRAVGPGPGRLLGVPAQERHVRRALEASLRALARQARTADDHGVLVDGANAVRPWSRW